MSVQAPLREDGHQTFNLCVWVYLCGCVCVCICVFMYVHFIYRRRTSDVQSVCVCVCVWVCMCEYVFVCARYTTTRTYIYTLCMHTYIRMYVDITHLLGSSFLEAFGFCCQAMSAYIHIHTYMCIYIVYTYTHTYVHTCLGLVSLKRLASVVRPCIALTQLSCRRTTSPILHACKFVCVFVCI